VTIVWDFSALTMWAETFTSPTIEATAASGRLMRWDGRCVHRLRKCSAQGVPIMLVPLPFLSEGWHHWLEAPPCAMMVMMWVSQLGQLSLASLRMGPFTFTFFRGACLLSSVDRCRITFAFELILLKVEEYCKYFWLQMDSSANRLHADSCGCTWLSVVSFHF